MNLVVLLENQELINIKIKDEYINKKQDIKPLDNFRFADLMASLSEDHFKELNNLNTQLKWQARINGSNLDDFYTQKDIDNIKSGINVILNNVNPLLIDSDEFLLVLIMGENKKYVENLDENEFHLVEKENMKIAAQFLNRLKDPKVVSYNTKHFNIIYSTVNDTTTLKYKNNEIKFIGVAPFLEMSSSNSDMLTTENPEMIFKYLAEDKEEIEKVHNYKYLNVKINDEL